MIKKSFKKLIRDKVISNLSARRISTVTKRLTDQEMPAALAEKLKEELFEFQEAQPLNKLGEAVDILTVARDWLRRCGVSENKKISIPPFKNNGQIVEELEKRIMNLCLSKRKARENDLLLIVKLIKFWALGQGYSKDELEKAYQKKLNSHGGFEKNVFLYETIEANTEPRTN